MAISRREFVRSTALATGFALAVVPTSESVIKTSNKNLIAGSVSIPTTNGPIPAYRAMPMGGTNFPLILVIQEIFGVHEHIQDVCRRFAQLGFVAVAPELFVRQGDVTKLKGIEEIRGVVAKVPDSQVMADLDATLQWTFKNAKVAPDRVGITGFCWGGRITWLYAAHNPTIKAGVAWYGRLIGNSSLLTPLQPIDVASTLTVPVLGLYGGKDQGISLDSVSMMRDRLGQGKSGSEIVIYPDAPHAFFADYRPSYRQIDAEDGWKRLQEWIQAKGVAAK